MASWHEIAKNLPARDGYANLEVATAKKLDYVRKYLPELEEPHPKQLVLDVGCGPGTFLHVVQTMGHMGVGILSPSANGKEGYADACRYFGVQVGWCHWGLDDPPFRLGDFDVVNGEGMLSMNPVELWPKMFADMAASLKPGGWCVQKVNAPSCEDKWNEIDAAAKGAGLTQVDYWPNGAWKWRKG